MALEPYDPCPCGNGKKFKFCCQPIIDDLAAVERLLAEGQPKQALVAAEKLVPQHANNPILLRNQISANFMIGNDEEALRLIKQSETANPWDLHGYFFDIRWHLVNSDWEHTRPIVEAHFHEMVTKARHLAFQVAVSLVESLLQIGCYMAAWRYLYDALFTVATKEDAEYISSMFSDLSRSSDIPLPFRSRYVLRMLPEGQPNQADFEGALELVKTNQWLKAGQAFEAIAEKDPHQPVLTYNAALCYAWAGDLAAAAELFGRSADDLPDFESAVQLETLAQLHEQQLPEELIYRKSYRYRVASISRLLSHFDQEPRLVRMPNPPTQGRAIAGNYQLLNKPKTEGNVAEPLSMPLVIGSLMILDEDRDSKSPGVLFFRAVSSQFSDADKDLILRVAGDQVDLTAGEDEHGTWGELPDEFGVPSDNSQLDFGYIPPTDMGRSDAIKLRHEQLRQTIFETWPQIPLASLDDLTPADAARDPDMHLTVCAAINVLATLLETLNFALDVDELRAKLNLPAVEPKVFQTLEEMRTQGSIQDCLRLAVNDVPAEVLAEAFNVLVSARAPRAALRLIEVVFTRDIAIPNVSTEELCQMGSGLSLRIFDLVSAKKWIDRGREACLKAGSDLMARIEWDMQAIEVAALSGDEETLVELLRRCARDYFAKVPECKDAISGMLEREKIDNPRIKSILNGTDLLAVGAGTTEGGLWTPEAAGAAPAGKLWLPGQD